MTVSRGPLEGWELTAQPLEHRTVDHLAFPQPEAGQAIAPPDARRLAALLSGRQVVLRAPPASLAHIGGRADLPPRGTTRPVIPFR